MKAIDITDKAMCTGCRACEMLCPAGAIRMIEDEEGFRFPQVNGDLCIDCGLCTRRCPQLNTLPESDRLPSPEVFAAYAKDGDTVMSSSSGGLFTVLAEQVLKEGGVVFGAAYIENFEVCHVCVSRREDLEKLRRSKYVASDPGDTFRQVKELLSEGRRVLYTGCPCQIAGLRAYLNKNYDNLLTADIICHGTPSQKLFNKYLGWLKNKMGGEIQELNFRSKKKGWKLTLYASSCRHKKYMDWGTDPYYRSFHAGETYRECCYQCRYANPRRIGDLTLGDYWGIETAHPEFASPKGVSLVLINTTKGSRAFHQTEEKLCFMSSTLEKAAKHNGNLNSPTTRSPARDRCYAGIDILDDTEFVRRNLGIPITKKIKAQIKASVPYAVKAKVKQLMAKDDENEAGPGCST